MTRLEAARKAAACAAAHGPHGLARTSMKTAGFTSIEASWTVIHLLVEDDLFFLRFSL